MAYTVIKTDGTVLTDVLDNSIDRITTDLTLVGKNTPNYGEFINENFIKLLENFSSSEPPRAPLRGQIWYDTSENKLKLFDGTTFIEFWRPIVGATLPNLNTGDIWIDNNKRQLYFNDGQGTVLAGPLYTAQQGNTGNQVTSLADINGVTHVIIKFKIANTLMGVFSKTAFTPNYTVGEGKLLESEGYSGPVIIGFNPLSTNFKFNVTVKNAENLVTQFGTPINVDQFVKTTGNNNINGRLDITGNSDTDPNFSRPLTLGSAGNLRIEIENVAQSSTIIPPVKIKNQVTNQDLALIVKDSVDFQNAVYINATESRVGIYNDDPLTTLDIEGDVNFRNNLVTNKQAIDIFNTTAKTVNFAQQADNINIASSTGDTIINNKITAKKGILIETGNLDSTLNTFNLVNTNVQTLNLAKAARTINIGAGPGETGVVNFSNNVNIPGQLTITGELLIDQINFKNNQVRAINTDLELFAGQNNDIVLQNKTQGVEDLFLSKRLMFDGLGVIGVPTGFTREFQLLNNIVSDIAFGGDATTITIGSNVGTTNIKHSLQVFGDITIGESDSTPAIIDSNGPLAHLFNVTSKEIFIGGQANQINLFYEPQLPGNPNPTLGKILNVYAADTYLEGDLTLLGGDIKVPPGVTITSLFNNYASRITIGGDSNLIELGGSGTTVRVGNSLKVGSVAGEVEITSIVSSGNITRGQINVGATTAFFDFLPQNILNLEIAASADKIWLGRGTVEEDAPTQWQPSTNNGSLKTIPPYLGSSQLPIVIIRENLLVRNRLLIPDVDRSGSGGAGILFKNIYQELEASQSIRISGNALTVAGNLLIGNQIVGTDLQGTVRIPRLQSNVVVVTDEIISTESSIDIFKTVVDQIQIGGKLNGKIILGSATTTVEVPGYIKRTWKTVTTTRTAIAGDFLLIDTSSFNVTVTLPASAELGDIINFADKNGISSTRKFVIARNDHKINGLEEDLEITTPNKIFSLTYTGVDRGWCWDEDNWKVITSAYTAKDKDKLLINNSSALISNITVTLPAAPQIGNTIRIIDQTGFSVAKPLIIQRNGYLINGAALDLTITTAGRAFALIYTGATRGWCYENA